MRDRHFPRICGDCQSPMARQEDSCWACGTPWPVRERRRLGAVTMTSARFTPAERETRRMAATERWTNEGGSLGADLVPAHTAAEGKRA